jgi:hypothetical protein
MPCKVPRGKASLPGTFDFDGFGAVSCLPQSKADAQTYRRGPYSREDASGSFPLCYSQNERVPVRRTDSTAGTPGNEGHSGYLR